jgi:hypothetical protein
MISEAVCLALIERLLDLGQLDVSLFSWELQDDGRFVLLSVSIPTQMNRNELVEMLRGAQLIAGELLPWRAGAYSWMINATRNGQLVESVFGGDLLSPEAGLV